MYWRGQLFRRRRIPAGSGSSYLDQQLGAVAVEFRRRGHDVTKRVVKTGYMRPHAPGGLLFVALGVILVAAGYVWRGRVLRPLSAKRAQAAVIRDRSRNLLRSADMAIAGARRRAARDEPAIVTVKDVTRVARQHYGYHFVEREEAAAALRERYEASDCRVDCMTDAFN